ncbi:MAG: ABC transporter ATP-binding protein [Gammaproteobacteria bacterium]|jgi:iron complex transport system ATP-binding protein
MTMTTLLSTSQLNVTIAGRVICHDLSLSVNAGESWGILGVNGVGKTTLLHTLAGLRDADNGTVFYQQMPLSQYAHRELARQRGVLFQDKADPFPATVMETVLIGRHPYIDHWQWESNDDIERARQALQLVGMETMENRTINTLSGGERQRVAIATLLAQNPDTMLLDEPTNHLDIHHQMIIMQLLKDKVVNQRRAALMILHDMNMAARFCDHILMMFNDGKIQQGPAEQLLTPDCLEELYGYPVRDVTAGHQRIFVPV